MAAPPGDPEITLLVGGDLSLARVEQLGTSYHFLDWLIASPETTGNERCVGVLLPMVGLQYLCFSSKPGSDVRRLIPEAIFG